MIISVELAKKFYEVCNRGKKVSRLQFTVEEFIKYFNTLNAINSLQYDETMFQDTSLERWSIPRMFSDFIEPAAITLSDKPFYETDFKVRQSTLPTDVYTVHEFNNMTLAIMSSFKQTGEAMNPVSQWRKTETVNGCAASQIIDGKVADEGVLFIPLDMGPVAYLNKRRYTLEAIEMALLKFTQIIQSA